jgi:hypothetical protein
VKAIEFDDLKAMLGGLRGGADRPLLTRGAFLDGVNGLVGWPTAGNGASTPDSAALDITGDIDIKAKVTLTNWTNPSLQWIAAKFEGTTQRSYLLAIATDGRIAFYTSPNGTSASQIIGASTVATGVSNGATKWVRATLDVDNGSSQRVYKFYLSDDGTTWTQLGTTVTTAGTTSIFNSTAPLEIAPNFTTTAPNGQLTGIVHSVIIENGFDGAGSVVFDANLAAQTADALAFTESSTNAATVTISSTRYSVGYPNAGFISVSTQTVNADNDFWEPFLVTEPLVVDLLVFEVTTAPASTATVHAAIYSAENQQPIGSPLVSWGPVTVATSTTGVYSAQNTPVTLSPGSYVLGFNTSVQFSARTYRRPDALIHTIGANPIFLNVRWPRTNAAFAASPEGWQVRSSSTVGRSTFTAIRWRAA